MRHDKWKIDLLEDPKWQNTKNQSCNMIPLQTEVKSEVSSKSFAAWWPLFEILRGAGGFLLIRESGSLNILEYARSFQNFCNLNSWASIVYCGTWNLRTWTLNSDFVENLYVGTNRKGGAQANMDVRLFFWISSRWDQNLPETWNWNFGDFET